MQTAVLGRRVPPRLSRFSPQGAWRYLLVAIPFITLTLAPHAHATIVVPLSEEVLIENAAAIVIGQVISIQAEYDHRRAAIFTNIAVAIEEVVKGAISVS